MSGETVDITSRSKEGRGPEGTKILGSSVKILWLMLIKPIEDYLVEKRCHPDALTYATLIVSAGAGLLFSGGFVFLAGVLLLAGSTADIFDGRLARALGVSSPRGAFLDSCVDRVSEVLVYLGVMSLLRDSGYIYIILLVAGSSVFVSYVRARAEGLGIRCDMGIMQRTERVVYLGVASLLNFIVDALARPFGFAEGNYGVKLALLALLGFSLYTAFERVRHTIREIEAMSSDAKANPTGANLPEANPAEANPTGANPWKAPGPPNG